METMQKEWRRFVEETQKSQEVVGEISKLYIILHENVRQTILKCTLNLKFDPAPDCHRHLTTILDLLKRMNDPNDAYLLGVQPNILTKFEEQLYELAEQAQKLLRTYNNTTGIDVKQLERIKRDSDKQEFGLKDQLKKSQQRRMRSRSGKRSSRAGTLEGQNPTNELINQFQEYKMMFKAKREKIAKQMEFHVEKKNNKVIFANKYSGTNLEDYFKLRKELFDLQIADQYTQKIVRDHEQKPVQKQQENTTDVWENKLFGEFKIKTKYMKNNVKQNILNALVDVKIKLLEEYHTSNMKRLNEANPDTLIKLVGEKKGISSTSKRLSKVKPATKHTSSASTLHQMPHSPSLPFGRTIRQASLTRYPMAHKTHRPLVYGSGWTMEKEGDFRETMTARFLQGKVPNIASN